MLTENAITTLEKRYLLRNSEGEVTETPDELFHRVADHIASVEEAPERWAREFYLLMEEGKFLPNTPTLMNAGVKNGQLSACYVLPVEDSIDGIFETLKHAAKIHQSGGGTGFDFSRLRPKDSVVSSKQGVASGPISFASVYNQATEIMKQGGKRKGANMMNLRIDHPDILDFIDMKLVEGAMTNFNVSVTVTDQFMEALDKGEEYELRHKTTGVVRKLPARYVWDKIAANAWKSAEPGIIFIDRVNQKSPYTERIEATNPCGEQPLPPYGSCNLGSINLSKFVSKDGVDWKRLGDTVKVSTRFLDNVIDANRYPTAELASHAQKYRNIGLGVMGWADMLLLLGIPYNSSAAIKLGEQLMKFINEVAHEYSVELAKEKGLPEGAPFKTFFEYSNSNRRNATLTTVAPTGSLCIIFTCSSGIEPNFAFTLEKHVLDTVLVEYHPIYEEAKEAGTYSKEVFVDAHEVDPGIHILMQAAFQKHCDSAISKTINLPKESPVEDIGMSYLLAWRSGCKGVTVYRDGSREGVLHRKDEPKTTVDGYCDDCGGELVNEGGCESCLSCGLSKCLIA